MTREVPVEWAHDERSKISPIKDGLMIFFEMLKIRWNHAAGKYKLPRSNGTNYPGTK